jgi:tetratricopeptide (TPR) repeat protein
MKKVMVIILIIFCFIGAFSSFRIILDLYYLSREKLCQRHHDYKCYEKYVIKRFEIHPSSLGIIKNLVRLNYDNQNFNECLKYCRRYLAISYDKEVYYAYIMSLTFSGQKHLALANIEIYLKDNPDNKNATYNAGLLYFDDQKYDKSIELLDKYFLETNDCHPLVYLIQISCFLNNRDKFIDYCTKYNNSKCISDSINYQMDIQNCRVDICNKIGKNRK